MNSGSNFALPACLAIAAALLNASVLKSHLQPVEMVGLTSSLTTDRPITPEDLRPVTLHYPSQGLEKYFWRWDEIEQLVGKTLPSAVPGGLLPRSCFLSASAEKLSAPQDGILVGLRCPASCLAEVRGSRGSLKQSDVVLETAEGRFGPYRVESCDVDADSSTTTLVINVMAENIGDVESLSAQTVERIIRMSNES